MLFRTLLLGWKAASVNSVMATQLGIWIKDINIFYADGTHAIGDPNTFGEYNHSHIDDDKDVVTDTQGRPLTFQLNSKDGMPTTMYTSPATVSRMYIVDLRTDSGDMENYSSWATLGGANQTIVIGHGRNIIAHELGHNFGLYHANGSYSCEQEDSRSRNMRSSLSNDSYNYVKCEVDIARAQAKEFVEDSARGFMSIEDPPDGAAYTDAVSHIQADYFADNNRGLSSTVSDLESAKGYQAGTLVSDRVYRCSHGEEIILERGP